MKIAIGISGLYRNNVGGNGVRRRPVSVSSNLLEMKNKFKADMYYHTWDTELNKIPLEYRSGNFFTTPEPIMEYHPIFDPKPTRSPKHHWYRRTKTDGDKTLHGNKQIIGYSNLFDKIPNDYDLYIRTRWDCSINPNFDFESWYDVALNEGPVGFMIRTSGLNKYDFRNTKGHMVPKTEDINQHTDWFEQLADNLIIHTREQLDTSLVYDLHEQRQLLGAEWGWWQVMSKPYGGTIHTSVYGGVNLER
jgi:hypothetical protein